MVTTPAAATSRHFTAGAAAGVAANWQDPSSGYDGGYSSSNEQEGSQGGDLVEWPKAEVEFGLQSGDCSSSRDSGSRHSSRSNKSSSAASSTSTRKASNATTPAVAARSAAASSSAYGVAGAAPQAAIPLFGRDAELRELERQCETMRVVAMYGTDDHNHRPPSVVLLRGPSGCGKTALAHELGRRVQLRAAAAEAPAATAGDPATPREQAFSEAPPQSGEEDHDREPGGSQGRKKNVVFVSGKVDQFQRHLPFTVILRSLAELGNHLLVLMARKRKMRGATAIEIPSDADLRAIRSVLRHEGRTLVQMVPSLTEFMEGNQYQLPDDSSLSSASSSSFNGRGQRVGTFDNGLGSEELSLLQQSEKMSHRSLGVNNPAKSNEVVTERLVCLAVQSFLRAFVKRIDPVVWFVDDLHWADDSSLRLLQALVTDPHLANVLFLLGYRPSEEDGRSESSSLPRASVELDRLWRCCTPRRIDVELGNLPIAAQVPWLAHMLNCDMTRARPLAELVHRKTDGNPYFVLNFLELLQRRQQLRYRYQSQKWDWNMGEILEAESPSSSGAASGGGTSSLSRHQQHSRQNSGTATTTTTHSLEEVVKMQIVSLPLLVQQLLQVASCLGFYFDEGLLRGLLQTCDSLLLMGFSQVTALASLAYEDDDAGSAFTNPQSEDNEEANEAYLEALYKAEEEGLIRSTRDPKIYQFSHDRVQQIVSIAEEG
jgi:predicted ATPase